MPTQLTDIELDEVSLVDKGANQRAHILLVKRDAVDGVPASSASAPSVSKMYGPMTVGEIVGEQAARNKLQELSWALQDSISSILGSELSIAERAAMLGQSAQQFSDLVDRAMDSLSKADRELAKAAIDAAKALCIDVPSTVECAKQALAKIAPVTQVEEPAGAPEETHDVADNANAESAGEQQSDALAKADAEKQELAKRLEAEQAEKAALAKRLDALERLTKRNDVLARVTKSCGSLPGALPDEVADLMLAVEVGCGEDVAKRLEEVLSTASGALAKSGLFAEIGKGQAVDASPMSQLQGIAKKLREADASLSPEKAFIKALELNPELVKAHYEEGR